MKEKNPENVRLGKLAKEKGKRYELRISKILTESLGMGKFQKTPRSGAGAKAIFETLEDLGRSCAMDFIVPADFLFSVDCKNDKHWSFDELLRDRIGQRKNLDQRFNNQDFNFEPFIIEWFKEAEMKCMELKAKPPILIFTKNQMPDFVLMKESRITEAFIPYTIKYFAAYGINYYILYLEDFINYYNRFLKIKKKKQPMKVKEEK